MSRVDVRLQVDQSVQVTAELDLTRAFGSADNYFRASQVEAPMEDPAVAKQLLLAAESMNLTAGDMRVHLRPSQIRFAEQSLAEYRSPLEWPRAVVQFEGTLETQPSDLESGPVHNGVRVRFTDGFPFEEPIATTLRDPTHDLVVSRWLVTFQRSPLLVSPGWFTAVSPNRALPEKVDLTESATASFSRYFRLGFWHILPGGIDHLLFLLMILLGAVNLRGLLVALSLYTIAHTLTFAASSLGWFPRTIPGVELLIALSIVVSAALNLSPKAASEPPVLTHGAITFLFGLLHGLGFAGALAGAGLPTEQRFAGLLGFNFGVEAAQVIFVLFTLPVWLCRRFAWYPARILRPASALVALIVVGWLILPEL